MSQYEKVPKKKRGRMKECGIAKGGEEMNDWWR